MESCVRKGEEVRGWRVVWSIILKGVRFICDLFTNLRSISIYMHVWFCAFRYQEK